MTVAVVGLALAVGGPALPARADDIKPSGQATGVIDSGKPTAIAVETEGQPPAGGSDGDAEAAACEWDVWIEDDHEFVIYETEGVELHSTTGRWLQETCRDPVTGGLVQRIVPENGVDPETVARRALRSVAIPEPVLRTNPAADSGLYVRVPTWLWVDPSWWTPYTATATAGTVSATVVARPVRVTWDMGDRTTVSCAGPGMAWAPGLPEDATDCAHVYTSSSSVQPEETFRIEATVELEVTWDSNVGASGLLGTLSRGASELVEVGEIQAIETR